MKTLISGLIIVIAVACTVSTVHAFVLIHEGVKSLDGSEYNSSDPSVIGHRVDAQGQFVLVYKEK